MKLEQPRLIHAVADAHLVPPYRNSADLDEDETLRELRNLWPNSVELAKQTGVLYRLHAILNA